MADFSASTHAGSTVAASDEVPPALCLNMIVKNETANLPRCLAAVVPHIFLLVHRRYRLIGRNAGFHSARFFAARNIPGELFSLPFVDFAQARNAALDRARASALPFDYLLLADADMELSLHAPAFARNLTAAAYAVRQRHETTYRNIRLLRRDARASYRGVTHEFLNVPPGETRSLDDISFIDHASGSNRGDKYARDLHLLTEALAGERDPMLVARYVFYLANTLRDTRSTRARARHVSVANPPRPVAAGGVPEPPQCRPTEGRDRPRRQ